MSRSPSAARIDASLRATPRSVRSRALSLSLSLSCVVQVFIDLISSGSSASATRQWLQRQLRDTHVKQRHAEGLPSRAAFKLLQVRSSEPARRHHCAGSYEKREVGVPLDRSTRRATSFGRDRRCSISAARLAVGSLPWLGSLAVRRQQHSTTRRDARSIVSRAYALAEDERGVIVGIDLARTSSDMGRSTRSLARSHMRGSQRSMSLPSGTRTSTCCSRTSRTRLCGPTSLGCYRMHEPTWCSATCCPT